MATSVPKFGKRYPVLATPEESFLDRDRFCSSFGCNTLITYDGDDALTLYCSDCKIGLSPQAVKIVSEFGQPVSEVLEGASVQFKTAQQIADFLEISQPTLYAWIRKHLGLSFRQFKRKYICAKNQCTVIDHGQAGYSWK